MAAPAYLGAVSQIEHVSDRGGHVLLLESRLHEDEEWMIEVVVGNESVEIAINACIEGTGAALREATMARMGIACIAEDIVAGELDAGRLRRVLPNYRLEGGRIELHLFYIEKQFMSAGCRSFRNLCTSLFPDMDGRDCASASRSRQLAIVRPLNAGRSIRAPMFLRIAV